MQSSSASLRFSVIYLLLYVLVAFILFFNIIFWIPFYFYRKFVIWFVRVFKSDQFDDILCSSSTIFADEGYNENPHSISLVMVLKLEGKLSRERLQSVFDENVINAKLNGSCRYPQLRQFPVSLLGYWFWKWDPAFKIENHILEVNTSFPSADLVHQYMLNRSLPSEKSPWQVMLVPAPENCSWVAIRIHHCLGDGRSMVKLIVECLAQKKLSTSKVSKKFQKKITWFHYLCVIPCTTIRITADALVYAYRLRNHLWRFSNYKHDTSPCIVRMSREIDIDKINCAAYKLNKNVCTSAYLMAAISGAIRTFCENLSVCRDLPLPVFCTLHKPDHPQCLKNHMQCALIQLPTNIVGNTERLTECDNIYSNVREHSFGPMCLEIVGNQGAAFVKVIRKSVPGQEILVTGMTNMAGENEQIFIDTLPCLDFTFTAGLGRSSIGVVFVVFSYKRKIRISIVAKQSVLKEDKFGELVEMLDIQISDLVS